MPFGEAKRKFLVSVLGEERTKALEDALPAMEARLEASGIGWRSMDTMIGYSDLEEVVVVPVGPTTFAEVEAQDAAREEAAETRSLTSIFEMLITNIMALPVEDQAEKVKLLAKALEELKSRVVKVGQGQKAGGFGSAKYVADLLAGSGGTKSVEVEELHGPAAQLVRALLTGGAVR